MRPLSRLKMLLSPCEVEFGQDLGTDRSVTTIGFRGNKGLVELSFINEECCDTTGILSLDCGELSVNETHLLSGFCRQERVEFRH
ncbi:hypothetical protein QUN99_003436 [Vibrio parahaemolyticus]|nr:hypothetical protein [Vibrio parahaemolyticus]